MTSRKWTFASQPGAHTHTHTHTRGLSSHQLLAGFQLFDFDFKLPPDGLGYLLAIYQGYTVTTGALK